MYKYLSFFLAVALFVVAQPAVAKKAKHADDIMGDWTIIDDVYGGVRAIGRISKDRKGNYIMRVVHNNLKIQDPKTHCYKCPKPFTGKPIKNILMMWNAKPVKGKPYKYKGAYGLDPYSGALFRGTMTLSNNKNTLKIRATPLEVSFVGKHFIFIRKKK